MTRATRLPKLNTLLGQLPDAADTFFVHDVALLPEARGRGLANEAVKRLTALAISRLLPTMSLIAVGSSSRCWQRHGFERQVTNAASNANSSYGHAAAAMIRPLV